MKQANSTKTQIKPISAVSKITKNGEEAAINNGASSTTIPIPKIRPTHKSLLPKTPKSDSSVNNNVPRGDFRIMGRSAGCRPIVEQFSRPRRKAAGKCSGSDGKDLDKKTTDIELGEKLALSEIKIRNLESQVLDLKSELERVNSLNAELESRNKKLLQDLAASAAVVVHDHQLKGESIAEHQSPKFKDIQKIIANKLEHQKVNRKQASHDPSATDKSALASPVHTISKSTDKTRKLPLDPSAPPPPPPPPPPLQRPSTTSATATQRPPTFVEFYHSLTKRDIKKESLSPKMHHKQAAISAHSSIVGEFENRSTHLMTIKADIETKGEFINGLIQRVLDAAYTDIEDVVKFAEWLDKELSSLADERAVLKHFKWPERKADAMREAAIEYRELKMLDCEISSYKDDADLPCGAALKKIGSLLDKSEQSIERLIKLRNSVILNYQNLKIPTDWMLNSGITGKIKKTSMKLAQMYMNRVTIELKSDRNSEREYAQEALVLQAAQFAYKAHQFAGGLDSETLHALEEIQKRVPGNVGRSRQILPHMQ